MCRFVTLFLFHVLESWSYVLFTEQVSKVDDDAVRPLFGSNLGTLSQANQSNLCGLGCEECWLMHRWLGTGTPRDHVRLIIQNHHMSVRSQDQATVFNPRWRLNKYGTVYHGLPSILNALSSEKLDPLASLICPDMLMLTSSPKAVRFNLVENRPFKQDRGSTQNRTGE